MQYPQQPMHQQPMHQQPMHQQPMQPMQQQPMHQQPMQQQPMLPMQPPMQSQPSDNYPVWGAQPGMPPRGSTANDMMDRPVMPQRQSMQHVPGFAPRPAKKAALQPWMLVVGALIMAALAFAVTRAFIAG